jgi:hypothetical protein
VVVVIITPSAIKIRDDSITFQSAIGSATKKRMKKLQKITAPNEHNPQPHFAMQKNPNNALAIIFN